MPISYFKLTADIDLSGYSGGHTISGLVIDQVVLGHLNDDQRIPVGLFGYTGATAVIRNLTLEGIDVSGCYYVSSLVGRNNGTITNVSGSGTVTGEWDTGGLVGRNNGLITDSTFTGTVRGINGAIEYGDWTGGLVGNNYSSVANSYAAGTVNGNWQVGGLVGLNTDSISNCYARGAVTGGSEIGGLVGRKSGGTVSGGYWDTETSGLTTSAAVRGKPQTP